MPSAASEQAMLTCREMLDFLADYREGLLEPPQRERFAAHLAVCPDCVAYLASYERAVALGRAAYLAPDDEPPPDVPEQLVAAVLASRRL